MQEIDSLKSEMNAKKAGLINAEGNILLYEAQQIQVAQYNPRQNSGSSTSNQAMSGPTRSCDLKICDFG